MNLAALMNVDHSQAVQWLLAIVCVALTDSLKIAKRFPLLSEITPDANRFFSVFLAVAATALFHYKELLTMPLSHLGGDALMQLSFQSLIYHDGWKAFLKRFFSRVMGPSNNNPPFPLSSIESAAEVAPDKTKDS